MMLRLYAICLALLFLRSHRLVSGFRAVAPSMQRASYARHCCSRIAKKKSGDGPSPLCSQLRRTRSLCLSESALETAHDDDPAARKLRLAAGMSFLTGLANVKFIWEFQIFATMLTGNLLKVSRSIAEQQLAMTLSFASVFACYMGGVACSRMMRHKPPKSILRITGVTVATLFVAADLLYYRSTKARWIPVSMLAAGYGMINSIGTDFTGTLTFVVTGHLTKLTHFATDWLVERKPFTPSDQALAKQSAVVTGGFFGGALVACLLNAEDLLFHRGIFSVVGMLYGLLFVSYDGKRIKRWWKRRQIPDMSAIQVVVNDEVISRDAVLEEKDVLVAAAAQTNSTVPPLAKK